MIGKVISDDEFLVEGNDDVRVVISTVECEWTWNKPPGTSISNKTFLDYFKERKPDISNWRNQNKGKQTVFNKEVVNENYVNIGDNSMFNWKASKNNEQSDLKPIGEKDDDSDDYCDVDYYNNQEDIENTKINMVIKILIFYSN